MIRRCSVAIIGGGITGLATAYYLRRHSPGLSIAILEASRYWGGKIITERREGRIIEWGPDAFITTKPHGLQLAQELGLSGQILSCTEENNQTLVLKQGNLVSIPKDFFLLAPVRLKSFWKSPLFSLSGKWNIFRERFRTARKDLHDESIASFVRRRFGDEALDLLGGPLLGGIYMGDPEQLSIHSTFPQLVEMERRRGSVTAGIKIRRASSVGGRSLFVSFREGMETLPRALVGKLDAALCLETAAQRLEKNGSGYRIEMGKHEVHAEQVVMTVDPENAFHLLQPVKAIPELKELHSLSTMVAVLVYRQLQLPDAFGVLIPRSEGKQIAAVTISSKKFSGRVPSGEAMLRVFLGGYGRESILEQENEVILKIISAELREILGITSEPVFSRIVRWRKANPQYLLGHEQRMERIRRTLQSLPGIHLAGSAYGGVGIPDCIAQAERVAAQVSEARIRIGTRG
jgi:oxygen-dependent protoporphyrinogen oxidase